MLPARFAALLRSLGPFSPSPHFAVALSGGADSLALTLLMQDYVAQHGGRVTALTVDHGLRAESAAEAEHVAAMMRDRGIAHRILTPAHDTHSNNLQENARARRYHALSEYCLEAGILHCLVAHNAGDNRETAHHNLARGNTADGASGMRAARNFQGVRFLRPLLTIERSALEDFLRNIPIAWVEDPSNQNPKFARVRTRQRLQQDQAESKALDATIAHAQALRTARDQQVADAAMQCVTFHPLGFADIDLAQWRMLKETLATQLLADCITTISGTTTRPRRSDTQRLADALQRPLKQRTLQGCEITLREGRIRIAREFGRVEGPVALNGSGAIRWDGRFTVHYTLPQNTQLTLAALGARGVKFSCARWGVHLPRATPSVWHLDELLHLPHIELPHGVATQVRIGFSPPKPLAAAPFW